MSGFARTSTASAPIVRCTGRVTSRTLIAGAGVLAIDDRGRRREILLEADRLQGDAHGPLAGRPNLQLGGLAAGGDLLALTGDGARQQSENDGREYVVCAWKDSRVCA